MIKTISNIILSFLLLSVTIGINISKHYSAGKLYSESYFGEAEVCEMSVSADCTGYDCCNFNENLNSNKKNNTENSCCENTSEYLHLETDFTLPERVKLKDISVEKTLSFIDLYTCKISVNNFKYAVASFKTGDAGKNNLLTSSFLQVFIC